jgi:hypothetical protein
MQNLRVLHGIERRLLLSSREISEGKKERDLFISLILFSFFLTGSGAYPNPPVRGGRVVVEESLPIPPSEVIYTTKRNAGTSHGGEV